MCIALRVTAGLLVAGLVFASCDCVGCDTLRCVVGRRGILVVLSNGPEEVNELGRRLLVFLLSMTFFGSTLSDLWPRDPEVIVELKLESVPWTMSWARGAVSEAGGASGRGIRLGPVDATVALMWGSTTRPWAITSIGCTTCEGAVCPVGIRSVVKTGTRLASCRCWVTCGAERYGKVDCGRRSESALLLPLESSVRQDNEDFGRSGAMGLTGRAEKVEVEAARCDFNFTSESVGSDNLTSRYFLVVGESGAIKLN